MTKTLSLKEARNQFSDIVDRAGRLSERVVVTKNGRPEAVVMGADEFESWVETLELLSKPKAVKSLKRGLKEAKAGKFRSFKAAFGEEQGGKSVSHRKRPKTSRIVTTPRESESKKCPSPRRIPARRQTAERSLSKREGLVLPGLALSHSLPPSRL